MDFNRAIATLNPLLTKEEPSKFSNGKMLHCQMPLGGVTFIILKIASGEFAKKRLHWLRTARTQINIGLV